MAGAGYKLFNTGDVLTAAQVNTYLQEQVVMVFADAAARTTALSGVLAEGMLSYLKDTDAVQYYNGSSWTTINTDQTPLTTKGDLFTYSTTDARLAVGNNGETLVADSSASTGLRWQTGVNRNFLVNGGMDFWQRGTSAAGGYPTYLADRWMNYRAVAGSTFSRQVTGDTTNLPFIQYCQRLQRNSGNTATNDILISQSLESSDSIPLAGQTIVMSFYARKGADLSSASSTMFAGIYSGTGTDQNFIAGFTGNATVVVESKTVTTTWQRFSVSGTVSASATQIGVQLGFTPTGTASTNDYIEITGVQIEIGSVPTRFKRAGVTLAGELGLCQRYYFRFFDATYLQPVGAGNYWSTTQCAGIVNLPVTMRTRPTLGISNVADGLVYVAGTQRASTNFVLNQTGTNCVEVFVTTAADTAGRGASVFINNNKYLDFSAEL